MPAFGAASLVQLATCHPDIQRVLTAAIKHFDFKVLEGHRGELAQNIAYIKKASKVKWPNSKHNKTPSDAADIAPWPIDWGAQPRALERFVFMQGIVWVCAFEVGVAVRLGIDWDRDLDMRNEVGLHDYPHVERFLG